MSKYKEGTIGWRTQQANAKASADFYAARDARFSTQSERGRELAEIAEKNAQANGYVLSSPAETGAPQSESVNPERDRMMADITHRRGREIELEAAGKSNVGPGIRAMKDFTENYSDIAGDGDLRKLVCAMDRADVVRGNERPESQRYQAYGDKIREARNDPRFQEMMEYGETEEHAQFLLGLIDGGAPTSGDSTSGDVIARMRLERKQ